MNIHSCIIFCYVVILIIITFMSYIFLPKDYVLICVTPVIILVMISYFLLLLFLDFIKKKYADLKENHEDSLNNDAIEVTIIETFEKDNFNSEQ